jgi:hypothetical protein
MFVESIGSDHLLSPVLRERAEQLSKEKRQFANEPIAVVAGNVLKAAYAESLPRPLMPRCLDVTSRRTNHRRFPRKFAFRFLNVSSTYLSDFSEIWDHGAREYLSLRPLKAVLQAHNKFDVALNSILAGRIATETKAEVYVSSFTES